MARMSRRPPDRGRRLPYTTLNQKIEASPLVSGFHRDGVLEDHLVQTMLAHCTAKYNGWNFLSREEIILTEAKNCRQFYLEQIAPETQNEIRSCALQSW
jgi:hypothetical protein